MLETVLTRGLLFRRAPFRSMLTLRVLVYLRHMKRHLGTDDQVPYAIRLDV